MTLRNDAGKGINIQIFGRSFDGEAQFRIHRSQI